MSQTFQGWRTVAAHLETLAQGATIVLNEGQRWSLRKTAARLPENGLVLADEVGMGKTRIASAVANAVIAAGGRVAVLVPPGLGYQWREELRTADVKAPPILRSLWQFLKLWEDATTPTPPWSDERCLVISHAFTNWRLGANSDPWRWSLLPEVYAHWVKATHGEFPQNYRRKQRLSDPWVKRAAQSIVESARRQGSKSRAWSLATELAKNTPWPDALDAKMYQREGELRGWLERSVGLGLGVFDLVVIDEAHKSRGEESGLSRLLERVILQPRESDRRRLALTATPVELGIHQWQQTFARVGLSSTSVQTVTARYSEAVRAVRLTPRNSGAREQFERAARDFQGVLQPYLIRRDKREEDAVVHFQEHTNEGHHAYRRLSEVLVRAEHLSPAWKQSICAAEALSFTASLVDDSTAKRLRLTLGNGHGLSALIDDMHRESGDDTPEDQAEAQALPNVAINPERTKQAERVEWWKRVLVAPFPRAESAEAALYEHPAILAAVESVERVTQAGEKVLVFGRFTRPLRALVDLLNARQLLRILDGGDEFWPQEKVHDAEWSAVQAAHRQLKRNGEIQKKELDKLLGARYRMLETQRESFRDSLLAKLESGLSASEADATLRSLFGAFKTSVENPASERRTLAAIARAMSDYLGNAFSTASESDLVLAFAELVLAASDLEQDSDTALEDGEAAIKWEAIESRVREEYSHAQGGFARLMHGGSLPATRRLLQLAFNRRLAFPRVLVAQSIVGREGLNLHRACRTVLLLHPEWNPGVVEQQIGRVDRLGSLWEGLLRQAIAEAWSQDETPRIEIWPIVFQGTYDESNWRILKERWDELRAQLHGVILTTQGSEADEEMCSLVEEINAAAPNFSPVPGKYDASEALPEVARAVNSLPCELDAAACS